jgi:RHS repeat-associated protein
MPGRSYSGGIGYRYGFNGQEKDNEVAGNGNISTAKFWEYDSRIGRRWNIDPFDQISISNYACFANNPIRHTDVNGDVVDGDKDGKKDYKTYRDRISNRILKAQTRVADLESKIAEKGTSKSLERKLERTKSYLNANQQVSSELDELEKSETVYWLNSNYAGKVSAGGRGEGVTSYDFINERVTISYGAGNVGNLIHELKHGFQYEMGQIGFMLSGKNVIPLMHDLTDENSAYARANFMGYEQTMPDGSYPSLRSRNSQITLQSNEGNLVKTTNFNMGAAGATSRIRYKGWQTDYNEGVKSSEQKQMDEYLQSLPKNGRP